MGTTEKDKGHGENGKQVTVTVDTLPKTVRKGKWIVSDFKKEVGVSADRALDKVVGGEFKPLADNQEIEIEGGEVFVSHVRQGGSS
jgi:hypothetical protein